MSSKFITFLGPENPARKASYFHYTLVGLLVFFFNLIDFSGNKCTYGVCKKYFPLSSCGVLASG